MRIIPDIIDKDFNRIISTLYVASNECWESTMAKNRTGYSVVTISYPSKKQYYVHRVLYKVFFGEDPKELFVCHACDNPGCTNPFHLFLGNMSDNMVDMIEKGRDINTISYKNRIKTHCKYGHEFTKENTYKHKGNGRKCRQCSIARDKKRNSKAKVGE